MLLCKLKNVLHHMFVDGVGGQ